SGAPIADAAIELRTASDEKIKTYYTDKDGKYAFDVEPLKIYKTVYKKPGYIQAIVHVPALKPEEKREVSLNLYNEMQVIVDNKLVTIDPGVDLTKILNLKPIYFDYNGYKIRESSKTELDKVVELLRTRPSISIQVNSHTDSRGKDDFNMRLSENRASATVDYIVKAGIPADRISGKGFGETRLINRCTNGVPCSEVEH
ncbi:OmpA family protein, partial [Flavobacterium sp. MC2016-06]|uniref:OmpA family protein n=1 Tax=Flavobacterium sp. MC2016-06 TaxID=2676308 RepID=UPI0031DE61D5